MTNKTQGSYVMQSGILGLLSESEVALVAMAETAAALAHGDEYVDLTDVEKGVLRSNGAKVEMGSVLPRKSVHGATWDKITAHLKTRRIESVIANATKTPRKHKPS